MLNGGKKDFIHITGVAQHGETEHRKKALAKNMSQRLFAE
jgi:hypothetical protein